MTQEQQPPVLAGPPSWAAWLLATLVPRRYRDVLVGDILDRYRDQILPAQGRTHADRWFLARVAGWAWTESRAACLVVALSFLVGDGLYLELPDAGATMRTWLRATVPAATLAALGVRAGWRSGAGAAVVTGFLASFLGTAAMLVLTTVTLAFVLPQLMKIGMSWDSLRDLASVLRSATIAGTTASALGGFLGAMAARRRT